MKKRSVLFSILLINIIFFTTCKKYEDDPYFINFRTPEARIHGTWDLESLIIDGHDSTAAVKNQHCYVQLNFLDQDETSGGANLNGYHSPVDSCGLLGSFSFMSDHNNLCFSCSSDIRQVGPFPCGSCWKIFKLTGSQLWLEITYNNLNCSAQLKKTS